MSDVAMRFSQTMLESKWMGGYPCKMHRTAKGESHLASGAAERTKKERSALLWQAARKNSRPLGYYFER